MLLKGDDFELVTSKNILAMIPQLAFFDAIFFFGFGPILLRGGNNGCLLIHGLTGTPGEMRYLGERLHAAGFTVNGILLAGHRTTVEDLKTKKWQDWYRSVKEGYEELRDSSKTYLSWEFPSEGFLLSF